MRQEFILETKEKVSPREIKETNVSVYPLGTLIVAMYGQGKNCGKISELSIAAGTNPACGAIRLIGNDEFHKSYIKLFFQKAYPELRAQVAGGAQLNLNVGMKFSRTKQRIKILRVKYLNNIIEEPFDDCFAFTCRSMDPPFHQKNNAPNSGFKAFHSAPVTLAGIDVAHMIRKQQFQSNYRSPFKKFANLAV